MIAYLNLETMPDGTVAFRAVYPEGFDVRDPAHQLAHMLTKHADSLCMQMIEPIVETSPGAIVRHSGEIFSE